MARIKKQPIATAHINKAAAKAQILWRIAAYIRLSKEDQNKESGKSEDSDSVVNQQKILTEYLEKFFEGQYVVVDFYVDDGLTGTDATRKDFMRMITDIEDGKVNCVICKTLSRAFRNYSDQGYYLEEYFPQMNVRFISTGDPKVDTYTNPEAITSLEVPINGLMNDRFAAKTSSDVRRTFATKRRNGEYIGALGDSIL
jgi:DNA invertase Pin-like site-specific DNA recombinase